MNTLYNAATIGVKPIIARRGTEHGSGLGRCRWVVERTFSWIDQNRRMSIGTTRGSYVRAAKRWYMLS